MAELSFHFDFLPSPQQQLVLEEEESHNLSYGIMEIQLPTCRYWVKPSDNAPFVKRHFETLVLKAGNCYMFLRLSSDREDQHNTVVVECKECRQIHRDPAAHATTRGRRQYRLMRDAAHPCGLIGMYYVDMLAMDWKVSASGEFYDIWVCPNEHLTQLFRARYKGKVTKTYTLSSPLVEDVVIKIK